MVLAGTAGGRARRNIAEAGVAERVGVTPCDAAVLVMDENVAGEFGEGIGDPVERFMYGASLLCCLPAGMAEQPSAATGTVMRPSTMKRYAEAAGFSKTTQLPIEDGFHKYYRLDA